MYSRDVYAFMFYLSYPLCQSVDMPRKVRIDAPGAMHHVIIGGIERRKIFRSDYDRKNFLNRLSVLIPETSIF